MHTRTIYTLVAALLFFAGMGFAKTADAATVFTYPKEIETYPGQEFSVDIRLDAKTSKINVVKAAIVYPADLLEVVDPSQRGSFLSLWPVAPHLDSPGVLLLTGGVPDGTYVIGGKIITITFRAKSQGKAIISFNPAESAVLLHDGKGTPAPLEQQNGVVYVVDQVASPLVITSSTHPDEGTWYKGKTFRVAWTLRENAQYSFVISKSPLELPDGIADAFTGEALMEDVDDGMNYFIVRERVAGGDWRVVARRKVLVDSTPPSNIQWSIGRDAVAYEGKWFVAFSATDAASGIARYDVLEGGTLHSDVTSPYIFSDQSQKSTLEIIAYDLAGNSTVSLIRELPDDRSQFSWVALGVALAVLALGGIVSIWMHRKKKDQTTY